VLAKGQSLLVAGIVMVVFKCNCLHISLPGRGVKSCDKCIAAGSLRSMKTYHARRQAGLCRRCGEYLEPERTGRSICRTCKDDNNAYERMKSDVRVAQRRRRRRIKRARMALIRMRVKA